MNSRLLTLLATLLLILTACQTAVEKGQSVQHTQSDPTPLGPTPAPRGVPHLETAGQEDALLDCTSPVPEDSRFALPPWPRTNFCLHSVPYSEIRSGGVSRDRIPPIDRPVFQTTAEAEVWLADVEPVITLQLPGDVRAYPLQVMVWHEIVNDIVDGRPLLITYCPLCNSALIFDRTVDGQILDFGTTGNIRLADMIMYDRQTESWWQQITGEAIVGDMTGKRLTILPASITSFAEFKNQFPDGKVLFPDTAQERFYGETPYINYDSLVNRGTKFLDGQPDERLMPKMRVLALTVDDLAIAYPYSVLSERGVVNDLRNGQPLAIFWKPGTVSALYSQLIAESKDVGSASAFSRLLDGQELTFTSSGDVFADEQTGSTWNLFGVATIGPLAGRRLTPVPSNEFLWFAWAAFQPDTLIYEPG